MPTRKLFRAEIYIEPDNDLSVYERLQALATALGPFNAHLALSGQHHGRYLKKKGCYVVVCTSQQKMTEAKVVVLRHGFHLQGSEVNDGTERKFVTLFQLAAEL